MTSESNAEVLEVKIALSKLPDKQVTEVPIGDSKVLVVRDGSDVRAFGSKCTHYGAPLIKGVYANGRIRCPWHGACFNMKTGDIEDFPGLDSLPCFSTTVSDDSVTVKASKASLEKSKRIRLTTKYDPSGKNEADMVILGGGGAGAACAENLRSNGFTGLIVVVTQDEFAPYDRPKLSKALQSKPEEIALRSEDFYEDHGIKIMTRQTVLELKPDHKKIVLRSEEDGNKWDLNYGKVLIATGGRPRRLNVPGSELKNIFYLRTIKDANAIAQAGAGKRIVIIGSSFIGMEVAAYFCTGDKAESVTIVGPQTTPFESVLGTKVGGRIQKLFEDTSSRVQFLMNAPGIQEFLPSKENSSNLSLDEAVLGRVLLANGESLAADICVVGIGVEASTEFLKGSGVEMDQRGYVFVNQKLKTNVEDVYAAGDIAKFPLKIFENSDEKEKRVCIGHWGLAMKMGEVAAASMCGSEDANLLTVPFFWSVLFGKSLRYAGYAPNFDKVIFGGSLEDLSFAAFYCRGDSVDAVATLNMDPIAAKYAEWRYAGLKLEVSKVEHDPLAWTEEPIDAAKQ